jgi:hypothetical protein
MFEFYIKTTEIAPNGVINTLYVESVQRKFVCCSRNHMDKEWAYKFNSSLQHNLDKSIIDPYYIQNV